MGGEGGNIEVDPWRNMYQRALLNCVRVFQSRGSVRRVWFVCFLRPSPSIVTTASFSVTDDGQSPTPSNRSALRHRQKPPESVQ
jgi:hypothetical protein